MYYEDYVQFWRVTKLLKYQWCNRILAVSWGKEVTHLERAYNCFGTPDLQSQYVCDSGDTGATNRNNLRAVVPMTYYTEYIRNNVGYWPR